MGGGPDLPTNVQVVLPQQQHSSLDGETESQQQARHTIHLNDPIPIRLLTHNIRYATRNPFPHEQLWPKRLPRLLAQLHHYASAPFNPATTLLCFQEVLHSQLLDIGKALGSETWAHYGVGRDDGHTAGEFEPIFWRRDTWRLVHAETLWLHQWDTTKPPAWNDQRRRGVPGWDGASVRVCTCVVLDLVLPSAGPLRLMLLNTHLDDQGVEARRRGAASIVRHAAQWRQAFNVAQYLLAGDLNSDPDRNRGEDDGAWRVLNGPRSGFVDVRRLLGSAGQEGDGLEAYKHYGHDLTFTGFNGRGDGEGIKRLDFVHYGIPPPQGHEEEKGEIGDEVRKKLHSFSVLPNLFDDGVRCSDHRAVVVDLLL